jgi:hypothetical protein
VVEHRDTNPFAGDSTPVHEPVYIRVDVLIILATPTDKREDAHSVILKFLYTSSH